MPANWHQILLMVLTAAVAAVVWLIRLEQKVTYLDKILETHITSSARVEDKITEHFERIESKLDKMTVRCAAFHSDWLSTPRHEQASTLHSEPR